MNVQAVINNISFPKTIAELEWFIKEHGCFNVENVLYDEITEWTVPKWILPNDIVFFFHAKTAIQIIRRLEIELEKNQELYDYELLMNGLKRARGLYDLYGGKIFAVSRVIGSPFYIDDESEIVHWRGRIYAEIGDIQILENPVDISAFSKFIMVSRQSAITAVLGENFETLKKIVSANNKMPNYVIESRANPIPLNSINDKNWFKLTHEYRRSFFMEIQFRQFYVDYLLREIADKKRIFSECACYKDKKLVGYVDNCMWFNKKLCFVEVKLNLDAERNIIEQLTKYSNVESTILEKENNIFDNIEQKYVIVIDTRNIGVFNVLSKQISIIADLDFIKDKSDLYNLRHDIIAFMK